MKGENHASHSLCWRCRNSYLNGCSWAAEKIPVKGWYATEGLKGSYEVVICPLFKNDAPHGHTERVYHAKKVEDTKGAHLLSAEIIKEAIKDYLELMDLYIKIGDEKTLRHADNIKHWFKSKEFARISNINPDWLIKKLDEKNEGNGYE